LTSVDEGRVLTVVVCGAGPASSVTALVGQAIERGWAVQVVATPAALAFIDSGAIESQVGNPVRSQYSPPGSPRSKVPNAVIVAPATYNTICKWAFGTSDTYALGILAEMTGMSLPVVVLPYVNAALASRAPFHRAVESLRNEGVHILLGPGWIEPHQPRSGADPAKFPWHLGLNEAERLTTPAP
jgi:phosphopantothenoylcysteine synthetase/decarboxylase